MDVLIKAMFLFLCNVSAQCQMIEEPSSGNYTFSTNGVTTTASVACDIGTTLSGDITLSCLENGTWSTSSTNITCGRSLIDVLIYLMIEDKE